jgi:DUF4097 and DUF4098 domain-containing protein YvlB
MRKRNMGAFLSMVFLFGLSSIYAQEMKEIHKTFEAKGSMRIKTVSGDCIVKTGAADQIKVDVVYSVRPDDAFEPDFQEKGSSLNIKERWYGSSSGEVTWTLTVPPTTDIRFSTASGDLTVSDITNSIEANTASGDITIENSEGEYEISTASGDIELDESKGEFELSTASGDIEARDISGEIEFSTASGEITVRDSRGTFDLSCASGDIKATEIILDEEGTFSTASGDVEVRLAESTKYDLDLSAASGDVELDYNGNPVTGYFEFTARKRRGDIRSPIDFDQEEEFERHGDVYVRKSFTSGSKTPRIFLSTASGKAVLKK